MNPNFIQAIHHINITIPSTMESACREFYGGLLGFREIPRAEGLRKGGLWYLTPNLELHISLEDAATRNNESRRHVCYQVVNLSEMRKHLEYHGIKIEEDEQPIRTWTRFYVRDPAGNRIEFAEVQ